MTVSTIMHAVATLFAATIAAVMVAAARPPATIAAAPPPPVVVVSINTSTPAIGTYPSPRLTSATLDTYNIMEAPGNGRPINFSDPTLLARTRRLAPAVLRVGGASQRSYPFNATTFVRLLRFCEAVGSAELVYGLHDSDNYTAVLEASVAAGSPALLGFSIGNEGVPGSTADFKRLRSVVDAAWTSSSTPNDPRPPKPLVVGPDVPAVRWNGPGGYLPAGNYYHKIFAEFLTGGAADAVDAVSWHHYSFHPGDVAPASLKNLDHLRRMWNASYLGDVAAAARAVRNMTRALVANATTRARLLANTWLTEENSVCDGGASGVSDRWANAPFLLNALGRAALAGVPVVATQELVGVDPDMPVNFSR